ncbi:hypothetical protein MATL_G00076250 [Megalops atlanticus]|uniref:Uncharacterized protein n=1 Tax=Megalops atlanticus TaxID=7932 RepID=A0A9D3T9C2_MEGAT|nr:hypothetical protein MATL_G00076250 [Megalops atlanticus]
MSANRVLSLLPGLHRRALPCPGCCACGLARALCCCVRPLCMTPSSNTTCPSLAETPSRSLVSLRLPPSH